MTYQSKRHTTLMLLFFFTLFLSCCNMQCIPHKQKKTHNAQSTTPRKSKAVQAVPKQFVLPLHKKFKKHQGFAFVLPHLKPIPGVGKPRAENCKRCHTAIYNEWKQSTHAAALRDLQYQAELAKPSSPKWLCLNCHIPVSNQRKVLVRGLRNGNVLTPVTQKNPHFDPVMRKEAITCATCHVRPDKNGQSVIIGSLGSQKAPHPTRKDPHFLKSICLRCHDPKGGRLTRHLMCWFKTHDELQQGPMATKHTQQTCVSCHMPKTKRRLVPLWTHLPKRISHMHHWVGGGVPKSFKRYKQLVRRGYVPGVRFSMRIQPKKKVNKNVVQNIQLEIHNTHAGHWMPTADPERFVSLIAYIKTKKGIQLQHQSMRIGQTWKWEPQAQKVGDNRLKPLEKRTWTIRFSLPDTLQGLQIRILAYHVRLSSHTARYMKQHASRYTTLTTQTRKKLRTIGKHYPLATLLFREDIDLFTGKRKHYTLKERLQLSYQERHKPLNQRDY